MTREDITTKAQAIIDTMADAGLELEKLELPAAPIDRELHDALVRCKILVGTAIDMLNRNMPIEPREGR